MEKSAIAKRLRLALDLYEFGERMQRQRLRRAHPHASDAAIERKLRDWRLRSGTDHGDHPGPRSQRFA